MTISPKVLEKETTTTSREYGSSTLSVHGNRKANPYHAVAEPIVQTATYAFEDTADLCQYMEAHLRGEKTGRSEYGRYGNPTVSAVESRLAKIEGAEEALLFSSGMAAITTILLSILPTNSHVILTDNCYRRTREFSLTYLQRLGIGCTIVPFGDYEALEAAIQPNTQILVSESPTNPYLRVLDLEKFVGIARRHGITTLVDATFATPFNLRPLDWGVDLVVHSATKYLAGHNDLLSGVVAGNGELISGLRDSLGVLGAVADPNNASLLLRGLKTLGLRIRHQNASGQAVAEYLESHQGIEQVWYPGLVSHPDHEIARGQMDGYGGVVSFRVKGDLGTTSDFIDNLEIPLLATSLGGTESLVIQPALMAFYDLTTEARETLGMYDNLVRLALGIEDTEDLIADLGQALDLIQERRN